jgi:hypothetical protein
MPSFGYDPFGGPFREQPWWSNADNEGFQGADIYLESKGWTNHRFTYVLPSPDYEPSEAEWAAVDWLIGEWDCAWARTAEEVEVTYTRTHNEPWPYKDLELAFLKSVKETPDDQ